ncbi:MAG: hypothetical protein M0R06_06555 [Sphaerochaeta sp.]|jgi:hypothetical protein|nr:hypothetical protein [Sphaerochaeta sp.]MDD4986236.1 hypothetical protein [Dehalococcoidales bacterium]
MKEVSYERYLAVIEPILGEQFMMILNPLQITAMHGALADTMEHPQVKNELTHAYELLSSLRKWCLQSFEDMGFTPDEVEWLDKTKMGGSVDAVRKVSGTAGQPGDGSAGHQTGLLS